MTRYVGDVCGDVRITPEVLARRTATYRRWLDSYTEQHRITVLTAPKGVRKEQGSTFISYEPRHTPPSGDDYRIIRRAAKRFLHYYFYVLDPIMGPMSLCVASYLPFSVNCFMNGIPTSPGNCAAPTCRFACRTTRLCAAPIPTC